LRHSSRGSPAAEEKTIKLLSILRGPRPHLRQLNPRSRRAEIELHQTRTRLRSRQMRLNHPEMLLHDASIAPNDPEILPRDHFLELRAETSPVKRSIAT
jgi:hypothetical protein